VAGTGFSCGLTADGKTYCWGDDSRGQLGNGDALSDSQSPVAVDTGQVSGETAWIQLTAGDQHACGLTAEGVAYCWGSDENGALGNGSALGDAQLPVAVDTQGMGSEKAFQQIAAGADHTCALTAEGVVWCWGDDSSGQLGNGAQGDSQSPVEVDISGIGGQKAAIQIAAGDSHTCLLTADRVAWCWGRDDKGQLCDGGASTGSQSPVPVDDGSIGSPLGALTAGSKFTCGITVAGVAYCCGDDGHGQLGDGGTSVDSQSPVAVDTTPL